MNLKNLFVISSILSLLNVAQGAFQIKEEAKKYIDITHDGKTVARVMTAYDESTPESKHETYKVYTHIFDKHGKAPITKGAGGAFTHHRGIFWMVENQIFRKERGFLAYERMRSGI